MKRILALLFALILALSLCSCEYLPEVPDFGDSAQTPVIPDGTVPLDAPVKGEYYYELEEIILYIDVFGELPDNFLTKSEAGKLSYTEQISGGFVIGGDRFYNREGYLPSAQGRTFTEADIGTRGASSRGAKRLVFSNDGLYFYTTDHYNTFTEYLVLNGNIVIPK